MKAFLIGLLFLTAVFIVAGIGFLIFPLLLVLAFILRIVVSIALVVFAVWLLGRFIIFIWGKINVQGKNQGF